MLKFVNENGILFSGFISIITALIAALATHIIESKREKKETIKSLQNEVSKLKSELQQYKDKAAADKALDKSDGSLYVETLPEGKKRTICGFCWEEHNRKTPIVPEMYYGIHERYNECQCSICKRYCRSNKVYSIRNSVEIDDLPF